MESSTVELRAEIVRVSRALDDAGLVPNKSGNLSCRMPGGFLITPSGVPYPDLSSGQLVELDFDGHGDSAGLRPSSEWQMHAAIYRDRAEVLAIVHTHSPRATALSCTGTGIPAFHYMIALAGGPVRCMPYATFGSAELADLALRGLEGRRAALLGNHGVIAVGASLDQAHSVAVEVENLAGQYLAMLAAGLKPNVLDEEEMAKVVEKFTDYGRLGGH